MRNAVALAGALLWACGATAPPSPGPVTTAAQSVQTPRPAASPTTAPPRTTSPSPAATPTRNATRAEVTLRWDTGAIISDVDEAGVIVSRLKNTPGIIDGFGDETQITVAYDPQQLTVDRIRRVLADMGFPTKSPSP